MDENTKVIKLIKINIDNHFNKNRDKVGEINTSIVNDTTLIVTLPEKGKTITYTMGSESIWEIETETNNIQKHPIIPGVLIQDTIKTLMESYYE